MLQCGWTPWSILFFCNIDTVCIVSYSSNSASFSFFKSFFFSLFFSSPNFSHLLLQCRWTISIFSSALCSLQNWQVLLLDCYHQSCKCLYHFIYLVQLQPMLCCGDEDFCGQFEFLPILFLLSDIFSSGCGFFSFFLFLFLSSQFCSHQLLLCWWTVSILDSALCNLQKWHILLLDWYYESCKCLYTFLTRYSNCKLVLWWVQLHRLCWLKGKQQLMAGSFLGNRICDYLPCSTQTTV